MTSVVDQACQDKVDVRHMTVAELARLGVRLVDREHVVFQCLFCGETWEPLLDSGGKLPPGYWRCPVGCRQQA